MLSSIFRLLSLSIALVFLSFQVSAQDFDCSLVNRLDPNFQGTYDADTAISLARCYLAMDSDELSVEPLAIVKLLRPINGKWKHTLVDSVAKSILTLDTSDLELRSLLHAAMGASARKKNDLSTALKHLKIAHQYYTEEAKVVISLLGMSIVYLKMSSDSSAKARLVYREAMNSLKNPELLSDKDYYSVYNNASIVMSYLGYETKAIESRRKLIYSSKVSAVDQAKIAYNGLVSVAGKRMCDTVRAYSKLILDNLDQEFAVNEVHLQLMKCAAHEDSINLGRNYYAKFKTSDSPFNKVLKRALDFEYYAMLGDQEQLENRLTAMWKDSMERNRQYFTNAFFRGYFRNEKPELHKIVKSYLEVRQNFEDIRSQELIEELLVSQELRLKEAEALKLEAKIQKEQETRKLQYLLAAALVTLLGVSLFALLSSRRKSKELANQNASISTLNRELNHRASNQLGLAYELIRDQRNYIADDAAQALLERSESQLMALKTVNGFLVGQADDKLELDAVLISLLEALQAASPQKLGVVLDLQSFTVDANSAVKIALVVNELVNNSIKYAWQQSGSVDKIISIQLEQAIGINKLTYSDNGGGDSGVVLGTGQGVSLIEALLSDVDARVLATASGASGGYEFGFEWSEG